MPKTKQEEKEIHHLFSINRFRKMGFEPLDLDNPRSEVICEYCGKISGRNAKKEFRHESYCLSLGDPYLPARISRVDFKNAKTYR